uniref:Uncharacterized protein n=1 Tax=Anopheles coluzzii TaxID=1518534 RepID=A0A8W7PFT3_ANOCL
MDQTTGEGLRHERLHDLVGDDGFRLLVAQLQDKDQLTQHRRPLGALAGVITHDRAVQHVRTHVVLIEQGCDVGGCDCNNKRVVISKPKRGINKSIELTSGQAVDQGFQLFRQRALRPLVVQQIDTLLHIRPA